MLFQKREFKIYLLKMFAGLIFTEETMHVHALLDLIMENYGLVSQSMKWDISQMYEMTSKNIIASFLNFWRANLRFLV